LKNRLIIQALIFCIGLPSAYGQVNLTPEQLFPVDHTAWNLDSLGLSGTVAFKLLVEQSAAAVANSFHFDGTANGFPGGVGTPTDDIVVFGGSEISGKIATLPVPAGANLALFHDITDVAGVFLSGPNGVLDTNDAYLNSNPTRNYTRVGADQLIKFYGADQFVSYQYTAFGQTVQLGSGYVAFIFIEEDHTPNYDYDDMIIGILPPCQSDANCNDGLFCNGVEHCLFGASTLTGGVCMGGTPPVCHDGVACTQDECREEPGGHSCLYKPHDQDCDDRNFCNGVEVCDAILGCVPGKSVDCSDGVDCTVDTCIDKGACVHTPQDAICNDGNACNGTEICHRQKGCQAGTPTVCNDGVGCTTDTCDPTTGQCEFAPDNSCDDRQFCNGLEVCDPVHGCQSQPAPNCDDGIACTIDLCNPQLNACEHVPDHSLCSNGLFCDGTETCNLLSGCILGTPPDCDDAVGCTTDSCDEANDTCLHVPDNNACSDGLFCTGEEICGLSGCEPGFPPCTGGLVCDEAGNLCVDCTSDGECGPGPCGAPQSCINGTCFPGEPDCGDGVPCTTDYCNPATNQCQHSPDDSLCNDGVYCNGVEVCNLLTGCQPGTPVNCDDGVPCSNDQCVEATDQCSHTPDNTNCNDGLFCNGTEVCHPTQGCLPGTPPNCDDAANCTADTCNEAADRCDHLCSVPQITCTDQQFECDNVGTFLPPVVNDPCSVNPVATCTDVVTPGKLPQERTVTRTCSFRNDCGNEATCVQKIDIVDTIPPVVTCPLDKQFECDGIGDSGQPVVSDNCDPDPQVTVEVQEIVGDCTPNTAGISPPPKLIKLNTFTVTDGGATVATGDTTGNVTICVQRIEIVDTHGPLIVSCPASVPGCAAEPLVFTPPTCSDTCGTCSVVCTRSDGLPLSDPVPAVPLTIRCVAQDECENASAPCDVTVSTADCDNDIPTVSQWGLVVLTLLLLIGAKLRFSREHSALAF
jgi:hypothetical protein